MTPIDSEKTAAPIWTAWQAVHTTLVVYAPFGTDPVLSGYPNGTSRCLAEHPLMRHLQDVARQGIDVVALIDRIGDDTQLLTITAGGAQQRLKACGKQDMSAAQTLAGLLREAWAFAPGNACVLALEGHGAGFLPDLDPAALKMAGAFPEAQIEWRLGPVLAADALQDAAAVAPSPFTVPGSPVLPGGSPTSPTDHYALATATLGAAFAMAQAEGVPKVRLIHFNNCFNMSIEVLHTVAPYAEYAVGYCNYNFFTACQAYPAVFSRFVAQGQVTSAELAKWFTEENHKVLIAAGREPTIAGAVDLSRMHEIVERVDDLADALLAALRTSSPAQRTVVVDKIKTAIGAAQQYDSHSDLTLDSPDELTDLDSFSCELLKLDFAPYKVAEAASALHTALIGIKQYGDVGAPWMAADKVWDFSSANLAMNIFLPDPMLSGVWDWRSQYYLDVNPNPNKLRVQRLIIDFVKVTDWVDFLIEYHKDTPFVGLRPALMPSMPILTEHAHPNDRRKSSHGEDRSRAHK